MRALPLRVVLVGPFLFLFVGAAGVISWISRNNVRAAAERLGREFGAEMGARIESQVTHLTGALPAVATINRDSVRDGRLQTADLRGLAPWITDQIRHYPHLTIISIALADGRYVAAARDPTGSDEPRLVANFIAGDLMLTDYAATVDGRFGRPLTPPYAYDPRKRSFMQVAAEADGPRWDKITRYVGYRSLGAAVAAPIRDARGTFLGVAAAGMALDRIDRFLRDLKIGEHGLAFVAERDGTMIAASTPEPGFVIDASSFRRLRLSEHPHPALRAAGAELPGALSAARPILVAGGERYLYDLRRISDPYGLDWVVGVLLPRREFTAAVDRSTRQSVLLMALTLALGAFIGLGLTRRIAASVERISESALRLARREAGLPPGFRSPIREVNALSRSLTTMAAELRGAIDHLEHRVAQRTQDLSEANAKLERLSSLDGLTGIPNRRSFDETLAREWLRARREGKPLSLILGDVDEFKPFNDRYGHQRGDEVLQTVARCLQSAARRPADFPARYGGEEFAVLLADTDLAGALVVAEVIRSELRRADIGRDDLAPGGRVTISLGVASLTPEKGLGPEALVSRADLQLYRAKRAGRDRAMSDLDPDA